MWKTIDKENTPPPERPKLRPITPPPDNERHILPPEDVNRRLLFQKLLNYEYFRMKLMLRKQIISMIKQQLNQVMQKLFEKGIKFQ